MKHSFTYLLAALSLFSTLTAKAQNVGIGTTSPTQTLDVNGNLRVRGLTGADTRLVQTQPDGTLNAGGTLPPVTVLTTPFNLGSIPVTSPQGVAVQGNYLYVTQQSPNQVRVYDISNPTSLTSVGTPVAGGNKLDLLAVSGNYLYVCDIGASVIRVYTTVGAGTVINPSFVTLVSSGNQPNGVTVLGTNLFIACFGNNTIERYDISNPALPVFANSTPAGAGVAGIVASNGYLYAANYGANSLQTFSVNTTTGALVSTNLQGTGTQPNAVAVANNLLYLTNSGNNQLAVYNLSSPNVPSNVGGGPTGGRPYGFAVKGNFAYISNTTSNTIEVRQLTQSNALGFDSNGSIASLPSSSLGDNLGNHTATTNINLNGSQLVGGTLGTPGSTGVYVGSTGRVGINTILPSANLDIAGGADSNGNSDQGGLAFSYRQGGYRHFVRSRHNAGITAGGNDLDFYLNSSSSANGSSLAGTGNIQVMTLESNNGLPRVGIGTITPAAALDVNGTIKLGINGTTFAALVRATVSQNVANIPPNSTLDVDFITNQTLAISGSVVVSPQIDLPTGISITYARVATTTSASSIIRVRFSNSTGTAQNPGPTNYYFTVFQ